MVKNLSELRESTGAAACLTCGKCTTLCPLGGTGGFSARRVASVEVSSYQDWKGFGVGRCLTCGTCEIRCPQGVSFVEFVRGLRGITPPGQRRTPPHGGFLQSAAQAMAQENAPTRSLEWLGDDCNVADEGEIALFIGCAPIFDVFFGDALGVETRESARAAIRALNRLGIEPVVLDTERCCGHDQLWSGDVDTFEALARANVAAFAERGVKRILTTCAECCRTWRMDYAQVAPDYQPQVQHFAEFLDQQLASGKAQMASGREQHLTFQDPCRLGRHLGVFDEPRRVMKSMPGAALTEMASFGADAQCCGTSGFIHCDAESQRLQMERLRAAEATSADTLVTACPKCLIHFSCAMEEERKRGASLPEIEIADFTQLVAEGFRACEDGEDHD